MKPIEQYEKNRKTYVEELIGLSKIPSVSFPGYDKESVKASANYVNEMFKRYGIPDTQIVAYKDAHPYVIARVGNDPAKPTYLLYAHHDVQPVGDEGKWISPPFVPTERDGRLFGRGTADDKAGVLIHLAAIDAYLKSGSTLPINVVILIDGEEEIGSEHLEGFMTDRRELFDGIDGMILTDTSNFDAGIPSLTTALRGIVVADVELRALKQSVHSGMWGGALPDPVLALSKLLAKLVDDTGRMLIPGIYEKVKKPSEDILKMTRELPMDEKTFRRLSGMLPGTQMLQPHQHFFESTWYQPTLAVNAIQASSREKAANIICDSAWAKVGIRIVPDMDPHETFTQLKTFLEKNVPWGCEISVKAEGLGAPWRTDTTHPAFKAATEALSEGYGTQAVMMGCGGSIPFVGPMSNALGGIPALLIGVEDPMTNAHSENESLNLSDFDKTIRSEIALFEKLSRVSH